MNMCRNAVVVATVAALAGTAQANVITDWNTAMLDAIKATGMNPPRASRAMGMVSTAVFDAVNSVNPQYTPYRLLGATPSGTSAEAAAITAAHGVLTQLFTAPAQVNAFNALRDAQLALIADGQSKTDGIALGALCSTDMISWRSSDGSNAVVPYTEPVAPGVWRPTPPANGAALLPGWGEVTTFGINAGDQFRPAGPVLMDSPEYAQQVEQVRVLGAIDAEASDRDNNGLPDRTPDQTQIARFWAQGGGTSTPPGMWNQIAKVITENEGTSLLDTARTFALLNIATADAGIAAWDAKYEYNTWRPITAIREADTDGNAATAPEANWTPLLATPGFPSYISGHSTFSSAAAAVLAALFGDDTAFSIGSDGLPMVTRSFDSFSEAAAEAGISRIYGGIHFLDDNLDGLATGRGIGLWAHRNYLRPIPTPGGAVLLGLAGIVAMGRRRAN